jgi:hypothetical protein
MQNARAEVGGKEIVIFTIYGEIVEALTFGPGNSICAIPSNDP